MSGPGSADPWPARPDVPDSRTPPPPRLLQKRAANKFLPPHEGVGPVFSHCSLSCGARFQRACCPGTLETCPTPGVGHERACVERVQGGRARDRSDDLAAGLVPGACPFQTFVDVELHRVHNCERHVFDEARIGKCYHGDCRRKTARKAACRWGSLSERSARTAATTSAASFFWWNSISTR